MISPIVTIRNVCRSCRDYAAIVVRASLRHTTNVSRRLYVANNVFPGMLNTRMWWHPPMWMTTMTMMKSSVLTVAQATLKMASRHVVSPTHTTPFIYPSIKLLRRNTSFITKKGRRCRSGLMCFQNIPPGGYASSIISLCEYLRIDKNI